MNISSSVQFRFGFEKRSGFSSVLKNRQFGFLCRSVVKYKNVYTGELSYLAIIVQY